MAPPLDDDGIPQAGMFMPATETEISYLDEEMHKEVFENAKKHYLKLSELSALEHHPGYKQILDMIDDMIQEEMAGLIDMGSGTIEADSAIKVQQKLAAANRLTELKRRLQERIAQYKGYIEQETATREYRDAQEQIQEEEETG
jgi:hypothetical protein